MDEKSISEPMVWVVGHPDRCPCRCKATGPGDRWLLAWSPDGYRLWDRETRTWITGYIGETIEDATPHAEQAIREGISA